MKKKKLIEKEVKKSKKKLILLALVLILVFSSLGYFIYINNLYQDKMLPNIYINGENYSGLTKNEVTAKLENRLKSFQEEGLQFTSQDKNYQASLADLGIYVNTSKAISTAFLYGHKENIIEDIKDYIKLQNKKIDIQINTENDNTTFEKYISEVLSKLETQPINFNYIYEQKKFVPVSSSPGMIVNQEKLKKNISDNISNFNNKAIAIELKVKDPEIREDRNGSALSWAQKLLQKDIKLRYNESLWEVQKEDFALWIKFDATKDANDNNFLGVKINKEKVKDYLLTLVPQVNREPVDALLEFKNEKIEMFALSQEGIALQIEKSVQEINKNVFQQENFADDSEKEIEILMITENVQPEITTKSIDNLGITTLLATGESNFAGSPKNRRHNIAVGAARFQGILIGPGDIFSFNTALGEVGPREGYLPELVIKQGETVPEYGGGLCQVSTTAFRGAVLAGLEITERKNHAYAVGYYSPQGTDATIYPPHPDLAFENNTPAYILLQTRIEGNMLYFDFYGSDDGRDVQTEGPVIYDRKPDGSMKAVWTQKVFDKDAELLFEKKFYSNYKSPNLYPHKNPLE